MQNNHCIDKNLDEWLDNCMRDSTYMTSSSEFLDSNFSANNMSTNPYANNRHNYAMRPNTSSAGGGSDLNGYQKVRSLNILCCFGALLKHFITVFSFVPISANFRIELRQCTKFTAQHQFWLYKFAAGREYGNKSGTKIRVTKLTGHIRE